MGHYSVTEKGYMTWRDKRNYSYTGSRREGGATRALWQGG